MVASPVNRAAKFGILLFHGDSRLNSCRNSKCENVLCIRLRAKIHTHNASHELHVIMDVDSAALNAIGPNKANKKQTYLSAWQSRSST